MKKRLFTIISGFIAIGSFSQTVPNAGFESWNVTSYENPSNFQSSNLKILNSKSSSAYTVNATKTTDAYQGNFAIKLSTVKKGNDTLFAFAALGDPGKNPAIGGLPYNQKPTGITFHYKSTIIGTDSAMVIVIFKKSGANIGNYIYKISSSQSNYTAFNKTFTPALTQVPDTIVFACASSNAFLNVGMPGNMLQVDSVNFTGVPFQPASFNGSFENWQTFTDTKLNNWTTFDNCTRTSDAYNGSYAMELQSSKTIFGGGGNEVGFAMTGHWTNSGPPKGGMPFTNQIDTLVFFYKYIPANGDTANISVQCTKNGANVGGAQKYIIGLTTSYTMFQMPFNLSMVPDTMNISIASSRAWPPPNKFIGSDLKIDNMYLKSQKLPVSDFTYDPPIGCTGQAIQLSDASYNGAPGNWNWIMPGGNPSSSTAQNPTVTYATPGVYTISMVASNIFGNGGIVSKPIIVGALPVVTANSGTVCNGNSITLSANGANTYTWNTGSTSSAIVPNPTVTTSYTVTGAANGCTASAVSNIFINVPPTPDICLVSVDSLSQYNLINWEKGGITNVDSFIVYREVSTGVYKRIGAQHYNNLSQFKDTARSIGPANGNPNIGSYRYKLRCRDACGNMSALSPYHNTVYFTNPSGGLFTWNLYSVEAQITPVTNFQLLRDSINNGNWKVIGSVAGTQITLTDPNFSLYPNGNWRVEALGFNCNVTQKVLNPELIRQKSSSNSSRTISTIGIKENELQNITFGVYPNPASNMITISSSLNSKSTIRLYDVTGKTILQQAYSGNGIQTMNIEGIAPGTYFIELNTAHKIIVIQ